MNSYDFFIYEFVYEFRVPRFQKYFQRFMSLQNALGARPWDNMNLNIFCY